MFLNLPTNQRINIMPWKITRYLIRTYIPCSPRCSNMGGSCFEVFPFVHVSNAQMLVICMRYWFEFFFGMDVIFHLHSGWVVHFSFRFRFPNLWFGPATKKTHSFLFPCFSTSKLHMLEWFLVNNIAHTCRDLCAHVD